MRGGSDPRRLHRFAQLSFGKAAKNFRQSLRGVGDHFIVANQRDRVPLIQDPFCKVVPASCSSLRKILDVDDLLQRLPLRSREPWLAFVANRQTGDVHVAKMREAGFPRGNRIERISNADDDTHVRHDAAYPFEPCQIRDRILRSQNEVFGVNGWNVVRSLCAYPGIVCHYSLMQLITDRATSAYVTS